MNFGCHGESFPNTPPSRYLFVSGQKSAEEKKIDEKGKYDDYLQKLQQPFRG